MADEHDEQGTPEIPDEVRQQIIKEYEQTEVAGLKANRDKLKTEKEQLSERLKAFEGLDPDEVKKAMESASKAEEERLRQAGEWEKLDKQRQEKHQKELEQLRTALKQKEEREEAFIRDTAINAAMREAKIADHATDLVDAYLRTKLAVVEVDGEKRARIGDQDVGEFLREFVQSDAGKHYTLASNNSGGGAGGNRGGGGAGGENPWAKETYNLTKQMEITKKDPQRAEALKAQAGKG